jgi:hypothetical protein
METLATSMGLNPDGTVKTEPLSQSSAAGAKAPQAKSGATPPASANKAPMKGSPAMERLKTPQHSHKPAAPTSAAPLGNDKAAKQTGVTMKAGEGAEEQAMSLDMDPWKDSALAQNDFLEWLKPYDTFTGDWGQERAFRSPQLTPATTPDTNVTDKTASTRDSEILDGDTLNMTLAMNPLGDGSMGDFMTWKEVEGFEPGIMDPDLMNDLAAVGIDENLVLNLDDKTDINDWEALFGPDSSGDKNGVPGWENFTNEMIF